MKRWLQTAAMLSAGALLVVIALGSSAQQAEKKKVFKYVGMKKCKTCHRTKARGQQYQKWAESPHAKAYEVLATEEAKKAAAKAGVKGDPQKASQCLTCHVTGYGAPASQKAPTYSPKEGVTCEACHGPGSAYFKMKIMKAIYAGEQDPAEVGLIRPTEKTCVTCHNKKSPTFKAFDYKKYVAKIAHPVPKKPKKSKK